MKRSGKGFYYVVSDDKIRRWMAVPPEEKLRWLEEANELLRKALTSKEREIMEKFRRAEI